MEDTKYYFITIVLSILIFGALTLIVIYINGWLCGQKWSSFENRWGVFSGCQVKDNGKWIPEERFRVLE